MREKLIRLILLALKTFDGEPAPERALFMHVKIGAAPERPTDSDLRDALGAVESAGLALGVTDDLLKTRTWTLTPMGTHRARQL